VTLPELAENIERMVAGGISTDETRFDTPYLYSKINEGYAVVTRNDYVKNRRFNSVSILKLYPEFEQDYQTNVCITRFQLPTGFISISPIQDGLVYVGSSSKNETFRRIKSRTELAGMLKNPVMSPASGRYIAALVDGLIIELYSKNHIKNPLVEGVWNDPTLLPDYNILKDQYPLSQDMIPLVERYVFEQSLQIEAATNPDTVSNTRDTVMGMTNRKLIK
jgi:hypothetical protein